MDDSLFAEAQNILSQVKAAGQDVAIFGAGVAGEALYHVCKDSGAAATCFCDNNTNKTGRTLNDIPVMHISEAAKVLQNPVFLISAADIIDVVEQLEGLGFKNWYDSVAFLRDFDVNRHALSTPGDFAEYVISTCVVCHQAFRNPEALFMRSVDIVITERCSLRCRDCANLMQYYRKPKNYALEDILNSVEALAASVDQINEVRVIGGEPLMNSAFASVVRRLIDEPKFNRVIIYTNGTICPSEERLRQIRHPKVLFFITHYGALSKNIERLTAQLEKFEIQHYVQVARGWSKCGTLNRHHRDENERNRVFADCCAKHLITLMNGRLYCCPFSANAETLGAIPRNPQDSVRILFPSGQDADASAVKREIIQFISRRTPLHACDICRGRPYGAPEIEPAVQAACPLPYPNSSISDR